MLTISKNVREVHSSKYCEIVLITETEAGTWTLTWSNPSKVKGGFASYRAALDDLRRLDAADDFLPID